MAQIAPYQPWLIIAGAFLLFFLLRITRSSLRRRVDEIGYWLFGERGRLIWFWLNAPGVILHELSHAFVVFLFSPFGFRITSITLFRVKPTPVVGVMVGAWSAMVAANHSSSARSNMSDHRAAS